MLALHRTGVTYVLSPAVYRLALDALEHPGDVARLETCSDMASLTASLPFDVNLWQAQNIFYRMLKDVYPTMRERSAADDPIAVRWAQLVAVIGDQLSVAVP